MAYYMRWRGWVLVGRWLGASLTACCLLRIASVHRPGHHHHPTPKSVVRSAAEAFTREDWDKHVTWRRFLFDGWALPIVVLSLSPLILFTVLISACIGIYATYAEPDGWPNVSNHLELLTPFTLTSFALSLLMLFKTNSSYSRWWEARTQLGQLYINVRSIMRMSTAWLGSHDPHIVAAVHKWSTAVMPSLCAFLRENAHYYFHLEGILEPQELEWLGSRGIPPVATLQVISSLLAQSPNLSDVQRSSLETILNSCDTVVGACERIQRQPMPLAYNRHTHRFLFIYLTFLPFALWPRFEWFTLPIMAILALLLLGVENIASRRATTFMLVDNQSVHSMAYSSAKACLRREQEQQHQRGEAKAAAPTGPGPHDTSGTGDNGAGLGATSPFANGSLGGPNSFGRGSVSMPHQFSQISTLPEGWHSSSEVPVSQLLGLAAGWPGQRRRISWDATRGYRASGDGLGPGSGPEGSGGRDSGHSRRPLRLGRGSFEEPGGWLPPAAAAGTAGVNAGPGSTVGDTGRGATQGARLQQSRGGGTQQQGGAAAEGGAG